jgi:hypothetical protein
VVNVFVVTVWSKVIFVSLMKEVTERQTDRHERGHKVFFSYAKA